MSAVVVGGRTRASDDLRRRASTGMKRNSTLQPLQPFSHQPTPNSFVRPAAIVKPGYNAPPGTIPPPSLTSPTTAPAKTALVQPLGPSGIPLPCPVLPRQRGAVDRVMEYLLADGPSNRYALICRQCHSHNGMALKEEFEYIAYRCCYCYYYNPARKQKPLPPRLSLPGRTDSDSETEGVLKQQKPIDSQPDVAKVTEDVTENKEDHAIEEVPVNDTSSSVDEDESVDVIPLESIPEVGHEMAETGDNTVIQEAECNISDDKPLESGQESVESLELKSNLSLVEENNATEEIQVVETLNATLERAEELTEATNNGITSQQSVIDSS